MNEGTGPPRKRRIFIDPELSEEGRIQAVEYRATSQTAQTAMRASKKRVIDFCTQDVGAAVDCSSSHLASSQPAYVAEPIVELPQSPKSKSGKPRLTKGGKKISEEREIEERDQQAVLTMVSLADGQRQMTARPSKKRAVDFSSKEDTSNVKDKVEISKSPKPANKRKSMAPTPLEVEEALMSFVESAEAGLHYSEIVSKFNTPIPYKEIISSYKEFLKEEMAEYEGLVEHQRREDIVHLQDCTPNKKLSSILYKRYSLTPEKYRPFWCSQHSDNCKTLSFEIGFLIYLQCVYKELPTSSSELIYESEEDEGEEEGNEEQRETTEVGAEEPFCPSTEEKKAESLSLLALKGDISKTAAVAGKVPISDCQLQLPILPEFQIEGNRYVLLSDIQKVFSIREDYALAAIAKTTEQNEGFESDDSQEFLDLEENFDPIECLTICFNKAKGHREKGQILSDEDFEAFQRECGFDQLEDSTNAFIERDTTDVSSSIDLYKRETFLYDETEEVCLYNCGCVLFSEKT